MTRFASPFRTFALMLFAAIIVSAFAPDDVSDAATPGFLERLMIETIEE